MLNGLPFGGNETLCYQLMTNLPFEERLLLNIGPDGGMRERFQGLPNARLFQIVYHRDARVRFVREVARLLRELRPRAIVVYPFGLHVLVAIAARLTGIPTVLVHAGNPPPESEERRRLWRWIVRASRILRTPIISCSKYVHDEFIGLSGVLPRGSVPVLNGIDVAAVTERVKRSRAQRQDSPPVIGMVARLSIIKDQETLVRAMALVHEVRPDARLWIVGEGETKEHLEALAGELGIAQVARFWGKRADVPELLGQMDVYVFSTTRDEGFGIAVVEGLAAGIPVIASDVPACREVLEAGYGRLVPPRDPRPMADAILELITNVENYDRWAAKAARGAPEFSAVACAGHWLDALEADWS
ncbi:MAG: glycosyltransferase [Anaeromyxobacteraceae bacterium]